MPYSYVEVPKANVLFVCPSSNQFEGDQFKCVLWFNQDEFVCKEHSMVYRICQGSVLENIPDFGHPVIDKQTLYLEYSRARYVLVSETIQFDEYVSDEMITAFITKCIPIRYGEKVPNYVNKAGIIPFRDVEHLIDILSSLPAVPSKEMLDAVEDNYRYYSRYANIPMGEYHARLIKQAGINPPPRR
jgi:hypothetical protein